MIVGCAPGDVYVKPFVSVPACASGFVTTTLTAPAECAGVVQASVVLFVKLQLADVPPKVTVGDETKSLPLIVTESPPAVVPLLGVMLLTVGGGAPDAPQR